MGKGDEKKEYRYIDCVAYCFIAFAFSLTFIEPLWVYEKGGRACFVVGSLSCFYIGWLIYDEIIKIKK